MAKRKVKTQKPYSKRKTQAEKIAEIPIEQVAKLSGDIGIKELRKYVRTMRTGYTRRVQSFKRKGLKSYAQIALEKSVPKGKKQVELTKLTRNQLLLEFARYSKFFNDVTSSEAGIKLVNKKQDIRIFGATESGRPLRTMSNDERERFWDLYDEFLNQKPTSSSRFSSESIQQQLADLQFSDSGIGTDLNEFFNRIEKELDKKKTEENVKDEANIYSGIGLNVSE